MPVNFAFRSIFASVLSALFLSLMLFAQAHADGRHAEVEIEKLTWVAVRDRLSAGATTILIPTGGTEQNGAHMALGKHNFIVRETTRRIALELGDALVAPVLGYVPEGPPGLKVGHMAYPGTLSLPDDVYERILENAALSFKTHGFKRIVFVGDSGGNQSAQARLSERLSQEWAAEGVTVLAAAGYYAGNGGDDFLKAQGLTAAQIGTHAGVRDTSELLFVQPDAVDFAKAAADSEGATGDARLARAEWGLALIEMKVAAAVAEIRAGRAGVAAAKSSGLFSWLLSFVTG
ncbi:MAG: creatininase family protein [Alphaproteobacteria bacterium]|nr:creatininase family protein [Alphaproteobacteria bacterium]